MAAALASGAFAQTFSDIPEDHWAGDAVERIGEVDSTGEFIYGTFRWSEAFTHYRPCWP